jgi:hypothetical protein
LSSRANLLADIDRMDADAWATYLARGRCDALRQLGPGAGRQGCRVTVPVVTVYRTNDDDMIAAYRVFIDLEPVFAEG